MIKSISSLLAEAPSRMVRIGDTMHIQIGSGVGETAIDKTIKFALSRGETVTERGVSRWMEVVEDVLPGKSGSSAYVWHTDGNRVRATKFEVTKVGGKVTRREIRKVWVQI